MSKIIQFKSLGGPEVLEFKDIALSKELGLDEVLYSVKAFALNRADWLLSAGLHYTIPNLPSRIGSEASGVVTEVGSAVTKFKVGLSDKINTYPSKLSGGQQQRLAIARALAMSPSYMLFDEIASALDPMLVGEVLDALRYLKNDGMTMMIVTHEIRFAKEVSDKISFLHEGVVIESGAPKDIIDNPKETETIKFLERSLK